MASPSDPPHERDPGAGARPALAARLLLGAVALLLMLLVAEGALSVSSGRSLAELWRPASVLPRAPERPRGPPPASPDGERRWALAVHEDPLVGYTARREAELQILDGEISTDALGLRRRPGPPPPEDALRILVLGDSVAFGFGLDDDETIAHQLEGQLAAAARPGARAVACRTVATPSWNHRNALAFVRDHWDELDGDVVLYLPIDNDLANTNGVRETGYRRDAPDPATPDPWLLVSREVARYRLLDLERRLRREDRLGDVTLATLGPDVLFADLSPESSRRYDENAASIAALAEFLERHGARLLLLQYAEGDYEWTLWSRLAEVAPHVPVVPLLTQVAHDFALEADSHPNAVTAGVFATWAAEFLVEHGWVDGRDAARLPEVPERHRAARAAARGIDAWRERAARARAAAEAALHPALVHRDGTGVQQVYGGVNPDGTAREHALLLLARGGPVLEIRAAATGRRDLYPLDVEVDVDGVVLGRFTVEAEGATQARWPLPPGDGPVEVRLRAERVVVVPWESFAWEGDQQLVAYRLLSARTGE